MKMNMPIMKMPMPVMRTAAATAAATTTGTKISTRRVSPPLASLLTTTTTRSSSSLVTKPILGSSLKRTSMKLMTSSSDEIGSLCFSTQATAASDHHDHDHPIDSNNPEGPHGSLFEKQSNNNRVTIGDEGHILRTFTPQANAQAMLVTGGPALAAHASFDPQYDRAKQWIQKHAVGPAVLSPLLLSGLVSALTEAAFPKSITLKHALEFQHNTPLLVGMTIQATIQVTNVEENQPKQQEQQQRPAMGHVVTIQSTITRLQDGETIAKGEQVCWIPDYQNY